MSLPVISDESIRLDAISKQLATMMVLQRAALIAPENIFRFVHEDEEIAMYFPYISFESLQQRILTTAQFYEVRQLNQVSALIKGAVVLDVGANIGNHTIYFSKIAGAKSVDSFEPQRQLFKILSRNIALNDLKNVTAHNLAVGAGKGTVGMNPSRAIALGTSSFHEEGDYPVTCLDDCGVVPDFVKIDVEGFHMQVLAGAQQMLSDHKPLVWIELREKASEFEAADVVLQKLGYVSKALDRNNYLYKKVR